MKLINIAEEDFVNYKKASMFIGFPCCTFKCNKESGQLVCQNYQLIKEKQIELSYEEIVKIYLDNPLTSAIVFGGLEPFDSYKEMVKLIKEFRKHTEDDIVIYTGYNKTEILSQVSFLSLMWKNIIIKFGRFIPNTEQHFDKVLGVKLFGDNQYAEKIS